MPSGDRGYGAGKHSGRRRNPRQSPAQMNRPSPGMQQGGNKANKGTAMSGANSNRGSAGAASQRGKQSMPQGARSKGGRWRWRQEAGALSEEHEHEEQQNVRSFARVRSRR